MIKKKVYAVTTAEFRSNKGLDSCHNLNAYSNTATLTIVTDKFGTRAVVVDYGNGIKVLEYGYNLVDVDQQEYTIDLPAGVFRSVDE